jgi:hypothetical protein
MRNRAVWLLGSLVLVTALEAGESRAPFLLKKGQRVAVVSGSWHAIAAAAEG